MDWTDAYTLEGVGSFVGRARRAKGLTQDEFAEIVGVSHATLSALENGRGVSSNTLMKALSNLGYRLAIVPKRASVEVSVPARDGSLQ